MAQTVYDPPVSTYIPLQTITLGSAASSVTFASIPQTYRDLVLVIDGATTASGRPVLRMNSDTGSNYSSVMMASSGTTGYSATASGTYIDPIPDFAITNRFLLTWQVMDFSATDKHKTVLARTNQISSLNVHATAGRWANNTAVTSLTCLMSANSYDTGSTFSLYAIEA